MSAWRRAAQRCSTLAPSFSQYNRRFGRDYARRMAFRQAALNVTLEDLRRVSSCYLQADKASIAVVIDDLGLHLCKL